MSTDGSNSRPAARALVAEARVDYDEGISRHAAAADKIIQAREVDPTYTYAMIGEDMGLHEKTVGRLVRWRQQGTDRSLPFGGDDEADKRAERALKKGLRDRPLEDLVAEIRRERPELEDELFCTEHPDAEGDPQASTIPPDVLLRDGDVVVLGGDVLVVGDSTSSWTKLQAMMRSGEIMEGYDDPHAEGPGGKLDVRVFTDQPYDQDKDGVLNDARGTADWGDVYQLLNVRGAAVMSQSQPPYSDEARAGIVRAGLTPVANLHYVKPGGMKWKGGWRPPVPDSDFAGNMNQVDLIILAEAVGRKPWVVDRKAIPQWLRASGKTARLRRILAGGKFHKTRNPHAHPTPKDPDVIAQVIALMSDEGDWIYDPFCGCATTWVACIMTGRRFVGVEQGAQYATRAVINALRFMSGDISLIESLDVRAVIDGAGVVATVYPGSRFLGPPFEFGAPRPEEPDWGD